MSDSFDTDFSNSSSRIDSLSVQTKAYVDDPSNWEVAVKREGALMGLAQSVLDRPRDDETDRKVLAALDGHSLCTARGGLHGGGKTVATYLVQLISAARGGFVFLVAGATPTGLPSLLRHVRPFFAAGGKILVCMPIDAVGTETLDDLRAFAAAVEDEAAAQATSGSLRFLFTYNGPSYNEVLIATPGNLVIKGFLTGNLSAASLGIESTAGSKSDMRNLRRRPASEHVAASADFTLLDLRDPTDLATSQQYISSLDSFWSDRAAQGGLTFDVPALREAPFPAFSAQNAGDDDDDEDEPNEDLEGEQDEEFERAPRPI